MARIDVEEWKRDSRRVECLLRQSNQDDRILPTGKQQRRPLKLCSHFPEDENRFRLQLLDVTQVIGVMFHFG